MDRRQGEPRQRAGIKESGRCRRDRRGQKEIDAEVHRTGFAIVGALSLTARSPASIARPAARFRQLP